MKIEKIINICKRCGHITIYYGNGGVQWISDGAAIYPLFGCPIFDEASFCATYDISDEKKQIEFKEMPKCVDFSDETKNETEVERGGPIFGALVPITTSHGVEFIKSQYLTPFADSDNNMLRIYERTNAAGMTYFAIKDGFMLVGIVMPYDCINEAFVKRLKDLAEQCEITLYHKKNEAEKRDAGK